MPNEKPIIFSGEMIRQILAGNKTMARRSIKPQPVNGLFYSEGFNVWLEPRRKALGRMYKYKCPHGKAGDHLWVRETFLISNGNFAPTLEEELTKKTNILYYASDNPRYRDKDKWKPSIHMPRWASRITLEITNVRVEKLQDISEEDAKAEGVNSAIAGHSGYEASPVKTYRTGFVYLWNSTYAEKGYGWEVNPFVWVIGFNKIG